MGLVDKQIDMWAVIAMNDEKVWMKSQSETKSVLKLCMNASRDVLRALIFYRDVYVQ